MDTPLPADQVSHHSFTKQINSPLLPDNNACETKQLRNHDDEHVDIAVPAFLTFRLDDGRALVESSTRL